MRELIDALARWDAAGEDAAVGDRHRHEALGSAAARREARAERVGRHRGRRVGRLRRGRGHRVLPQRDGRRAAAAARLRDRRRRGVGRRPAVRRRDRGLGPAPRPGGPRRRASRQRVRNGERVVLVTAIDGVPEPGATLLVTADDEPDGCLGDPALDDAALELAQDALWTERCGLVDTGHGRVFLDAVAPPPRLFVFGAVDVARPPRVARRGDGLARVRRSTRGASSRPRRGSRRPSRSSRRGRRRRCRRSAASTARRRSSS